MTRFIAVLLFLFGFQNIAFAHGEDKSGPHGGFIRMPGTFHTEVVLAGKSALKVFLLDLQSQNPSIQKGKVSATAKFGKTATAVCRAKEDFYFCNFGPQVDLTAKGLLTIQATREGIQGTPADYPLPLALPPPSGHGHH